MYLICEKHKTKASQAKAPCFTCIREDRDRYREALERLANDASAHQRTRDIASEALNPTK